VHAELDRLLDFVAAQVCAEEEAILRQVEEQVCQTRARAEEQVAALRQEARREGEERGRRRAAAVRAAAESRGYLEALRVREELVEDVFERALARLAELLAGPDGPELRRGLLNDARSVLPSGRLRVRVAVRDSELDRSFDSGSEPPLLLVEVCPNLAPGVWVETEDGRMAVDASFRRCLESRRDELRVLVTRCLDLPLRVPFPGVPEGEGR
jgi:vacuolar-type H+-ATPase subunit E/Vma4